MEYGIYPDGKFPAHEDSEQRSGRLSLHAKVSRKKPCCSDLLAGTRVKWTRKWTSRKKKAGER